jgi:hypothetical protein
MSSDSAIRTIRDLVAGTAVATFLACAPTARPFPDRLPLIEGRVLERLDVPPYSYLRLESAIGEVWVGVPVSQYPKEAMAKVRDAALVRDHRLPVLGRTLDAVYFGRLVSR